MINARDTTAGYQGPPAPQQWFGGVLSPRAGSIALVDASGAVVVDAVVYGSQQSSSSANGTIASPEIATLEAEQSQGGCIAVVPNVGRGFGPAPASAMNRSLGRFPDGRDLDALCKDFFLQAATTLSASSAAGATNIKVASVAGFSAGQAIAIDGRADFESAVIATVGTAGASTVRTAVRAGATVIPVVNAAGFSAGQSITIGGGANQESVVVASTARGGRGGGASITIAAPLTLEHAVQAQVSGSGITLTAALGRAHPSGAQVARNVPTPGAANQYDSSAR